VVDLSAFYLDILKDRLYTCPKTSKARRSGQTAMYDLLNGMARLMAPILSFTAEEVWTFIPADGKKASSVHLAPFPDLSGVTFSEELAEKWERIKELKGEVSKALELRRKEKVIGHSLDASVSLAAPSALKPLLEGERDRLKFIFIVSGVELVDQLDGDAYQSDVIEGLKVGVKPAPGKKCERCWNYFVETEASADHPSICKRCVTNLESARA